MDRIRRGIVAAAALSPLLSAAAAEAFPSRPLRLVVPNPPGGTVDLLARFVAQGLQESLRQTTVVEPRPGGNTVIGSDIVARSAPDGHTILMIGTPFAINPLVRPLPYDPFRDFAPVARLATLPLVLAVHPTVPARSLEELLALGRKRPGTLNYASFGIGQLAGESLKRGAGVDMNFIPYSGGVQATGAVVAGHANVLVGPLSDALPHITAGKLQALVVTSLARAEMLPDVPTVAESGYPGFDWSLWIGAAVRAGTPGTIVDLLAQEMTRALQRSEADVTLSRLNVSRAPLGPGEFLRSIHAHMKTYESIIRDAGIKLE